MQLNKTIGIALMMLLMASSCQNNSDTTRHPIKEDTLEIIDEHPDTNSFEYFRSSFKAVDLPLHIDSAYALSGGAYLVDKIDTIFDMSSFFIPAYQLEHWLVDTTKENVELNSWYKENKQNYNDTEWTWFAVLYGYYFQDAGLDYFITYRYNQVSAINGGYWTYFLHCMDSTHQLRYTKQLGEDNYYTYTDMKETEDDLFWQRRTEITTFEFDIYSADKIYYCEYNYLMIEGDLLGEDTKMLNELNVDYDTSFGLTKIFPEKCGYLK